jgi:GT2 family glycosyltransferase
VSRKTRPRGFGGVFILLKKSAWKTIHGFKKKGFTGVDDDLRLRLHRAKIPFHIMNGVYVYHWYRADNPYPHGNKRIRKINKTYQKHNKENFELNKVFLY